MIDEGKNEPEAKVKVKAVGFNNGKLKPPATCTLHAQSKCKKRERKIVKIGITLRNNIRNEWKWKLFVVHTKKVLILENRKWNGQAVRQANIQILQADRLIR